MSATTIQKSRLKIQPVKREIKNIQTLSESILHQLELLNQVKN
jgi:hypothetical protein